jgi:hypothetical protein
MLDFSADCDYVIPTQEGPQKDALSSPVREVTACRTVPQAIRDQQSHLSLYLTVQCARAEQTQRLR